MSRLIIICILISFAKLAVAWNALGHKLIAQIAYDNLDTATKKRCALYNRTLMLTARASGTRNNAVVVLRPNHFPDMQEFPANIFYKKLSFINSAVWLDTLYSKNLSSLKSLHYIDLPWHNIAKPNPINAVWAVRILRVRYLDSKIATTDKGIAVRMLLHIIGDLHQPMHTITQINHRYPQGDKGGNEFLLAKNPVANQLHAYWDRGGGILINWPSTNMAAIKRQAHILEHKYPCIINTQDLDPMHWAQESHALAAAIAYTKLSVRYPDSTYQQLAQQISEKRIALAGCRLAAVLIGLS